MKNRVNKQIIKALSVGLAASMALQPVAVYAADGTPGEENEAQDPVDVAFENATKETQEASDALVTTDETKNLETKEVDGQETEVHIPSATVATENEKEVVAGVANTINPELAPDKQVDTVGYDAAATKLGDSKDNEGKNLGADGDVQDALTAIDEAKTANAQIKDSLAASKEVTDSLEHGTTATPEKNGVKEAHQVNVDQYGVKANEEKEIEATGSIKNSNDAQAGFEAAGKKAGEAAGQFDNVTNSASDYANTGAVADVTGTVLSGIKLDAEAAGKTLEDAGKLLEQAEKDLTSAQEKKDDADIAYADAENELKDATKALKIVLGLNPDSDDEIPPEYLNTKDTEGNDELGASAKQIELAKAALSAASDKLTKARNACDDAKKAVEKALNGLNDAKYAELVALKDAIAAAENSEELDGEAKENAVNTAKENFKKALIKYYYFSELGEGESVDFGEAGFDLDELDVNVRTNEDGTKYFAGYDADNDYAEVWRPISELGPTFVAVKKDKDGNVVAQKRYSVTEGENGVYTIVDITEAATEVAETKGTIPAKYVIKDQNGNVTETKSVAELEGNTELIKLQDTDEAGNTTGIHVADTVIHRFDTEKFKVVDASELATLGGQVGDTVYVKTNAEPIRDIDYVTEEIPTGRNVTEEQDQATRPCYDLDTANSWCKYVKDNVVDEKYKDSVKVQYRQSIWIPGFGVFVTRWFDDDKDLADYLATKYGDILGTTEYQVAYKADVDTGIAETEEVTGLLVEEKGQYNEYVLTESKAAGNFTGYYTKNNGDFDTLPGNANKNAVDAAKNRISNALKEDFGNNADIDVESVWYNGKYYFYCTISTPAEYEWKLQKNTVNLTTSKIMYNSKDYSYVAPETKNLDAYYSLGYAYGNSGTVNNGTDNDAYAKQRAYNSAKADFESAQATFDATDAAFNKAAKELQEATDALNNFGQLELAGRTKKEYVDKYNEAKAAFDVASANKKDAEDALEAAKKAKIDAQAEFDKADLAKKAADDAVDKADAAKKAADDARNTTDDTTGTDTTTPVGDDDDDDDTTTGGGDDTAPSATFIAAAPATQAVTPLVADEGAAVLGEVRRTASRNSSAKNAASTETAATDNSNGNGNGDNQTVAGAQKEETKTPEAPKTESTIEETETALAATPELEEKGFAWWWLLILAAIAGVSVEEYARRKSNKAKAEAKDSTKINK